MNRHVTAGIVAVWAVVGAGGAATAQPEAALGTGITYQGQLKLDGVPYNGTQTVEFHLYDALTGGTLLGSQTLSVNAVDGLFSVVLNASGEFGPSAFDGNARWLEVEVHNNILSPRQPINAAPYALYALSGPVGGDSVWSVNGTDVYVGSGSVGIGTTDPTRHLHVAQVSSPFTSAVYARLETNSELGAILEFKGVPDDGFSLGNPIGVLSYLDTADVERAKIEYKAHEADYGELNFWFDGVERMSLQSDGDLALGTHVPYAKMHIEATDLALVSTSLTNDDVIIEDSDAVLGLYSSAGGSYGSAIALGELDAGAFVNKWSIHRTTTSGGNDLRFAFGGSNDYSANFIAMTLTDDLKVGIGTYAPTDKLQVVGGTDSAPSGGGYIVTGTTTSTNISIDNNEILARNNGAGSTLYLNHDGGTVTMVASSGSGVGIGTTVPKGKLHVNGDYYGLGHLWLHAYEGDGNSGSAYVQARDTSGSSDIDLVLRAQLDGGTVDVLRCKSNGYTSVKVLEITGADLAEKFPSTEQAEAGTVMEIDPDQTGHVRVSRGAYNRRVAGVVSGANDFHVGAILGNLPGSEDAPPIALSGRVWVKCDTSNGAIEVGDLLTTSAQPGHAMKVKDHAAAQGAILGKAMSALNDGSGLVLVLVTLQ